MQRLDFGTPQRPARGRASIFRLLTALAVFLALGSNHTTAQAVRLARPRPRPEFSGFSTLTVAATPASVSFTLIHGGTASGTSSITTTTTYAGGVGIASTVNLYAYFSSAANALTGGTPSASIPSSDVYGIVPGGLPTSYTAFTQTTPFSGASGLELSSETTLLVGNGTFSHTLSLQIRLAATPQLPAATYTGTISFEAVAM